MALRTISVCAGVGGLDLAVHLGAEFLGLGPVIPICIIEREVTAVHKLVARMEDGSFPAAPIWSDLITFDGRPFRRRVDLILAGLPCQPYSVAGKQLGHEDERALWPEFIRVVGEVQPALVFLENVPPFIRYFRPVGCELQRMGYRVEEPLFVTAAECGAAHKRERVFILAHNEHARFLRRGTPYHAFRRENASWDNLYGCNPGMAQPTLRGRRVLRESSERDGLTGGGIPNLEHPNQHGSPAGLSGSLPRQEGGADQLEYGDDAMENTGCTRGGGPRNRKDSIGEGHQVTIGEQAEMWATPNVPMGGRTMSQEDVEAKGATAKGKRQVGREMQARYQEFPTPASRDYRSPNLKPYGQRGWADEGRAVEQLYRAPLTVPGPGARDEWRDILAEFPWLEPARSRFDWLCDGLRDAGLLPVGAAGVAAAGPAKILRDRGRGRLVGEYIGRAIAAERTSGVGRLSGVGATRPGEEEAGRCSAKKAAQAMGVPPAHDELGESVHLDSRELPPEVEPAIRRVFDDVAAILDERSSSLRAGGNGVMAVQGALAFVDLIGRVIG